MDACGCNKTILLMMVLLSTLAFSDAFTRPFQPQSRHHVSISSPVADRDRARAGVSSPRPSDTTGTALSMSLKPAAIPLMDSGKALARSGELLIDLTSDMELYGGALSAAGALIRNAGDAVAQAAALCRFKTGAELACDEVREAATCLTEAHDKVKQAVEEAHTDEDPILAAKLEKMAETLAGAGKVLEEAGKEILIRSSLSKIGGKLVGCGTQLEIVSAQIKEIRPKASNGEISSQRMAYAAEKMIEAGNELQGATKPKSKGKGWLKG